MTTTLVARRRVALRLLLFEAALLGGILGAFALISLWRVGTAPLQTLVLLGGALIAPVLGAEWYWVRRDWKLLDAGLGERERGP
ncbi:MAG TPA: hypothetical protein VEY12_05355 [Thermoplasmata archaeon]|nr:hypothetical protein [Thermoplasmata archaeon]